VVNSLLGGTAAITAMRRSHQADEEWVVIVDLDEFVEFPSGIAYLVDAADRAGANVVRGTMYDRFDADGRIVDFARGSDLSVVYPIKSRFIKSVMGGLDYKGVLVKGHMKPASAHHRFEGERLFPDLLEISHYKWIGGSMDRMRESYRLAVEAGVSWAFEYKNAIDHYDAHGRFAWETFGGRPAQDCAPDIWQACADCGAPVSEAECAFSTGQFGKALCRADQQKHLALKA
jgi:hypothetical protein